VVRLITGGIMHETHTFSVEPTPFDAWSIARGAEADHFAGTNHSLGGVIDGCRELGVDLVHTLFSQATASGPASRPVFEAMLRELLDGIDRALPADGIVLTLHGAMVAEGYEDAEAEIVRAVRSLTGMDIPIAVTLDLHANTSRELIEQSTLVVGYDTYPHIDLADRSREAVRLLVQTIIGEITPTMAIARPPLLPVPQALFTARHPMNTLFDRAFALEADGTALSITIAGGFAYADTPRAGLSITAITDDDAEAARRFAAEIAALAWDLRGDMLVHNVAPAVAVAEAMAHPTGPVVLVDVGDNIGGGTPGDGTVLFAELLRQGAQEATVVIADPESVEAALAAGVHGTFETSVGGKTDRHHGEPVPVSGRVTLITDGRWIHAGPENAGVPVTMGPTAVVRVDGVNLVLTSIKAAPGDLNQLRSVGIEPSRQEIIVVKAAVRWRGGYGPITRHSIDVDTPGLGSADLSRFKFKHLRRPMFPLDPHTVWSPDAFVAQEP
jgi:microcystin degradation protein MlrC